MMTAQIATWLIAVLSTAGVILRPFGWPEAVWAAGGALLLVISRLIAPGDALAGIGKGVDVYLFLTGMMLLSELARAGGLFEWAATVATRLAKGSPTRLFALIYGVGTVVTVFLSNDATAVVLTPAVYAATQAARVQEPLPFLYIGAFVANAASFVLPISNPANLVVYGGGHMPRLGEWLAVFLLPSAVSVAATYAILRWSQAATLRRDSVATQVASKTLSTDGKIAAGGIALTAIALIASSAAGIDLGAPTLIAGTATAIVSVAIGHARPLSVLREIAWGVLPLVAGLFVLVEALDRTGVVRALSHVLRDASEASVSGTAASAGVLVALVSNLVNNLPSGLIAGSAVQGASLPPVVTSALLIGVDLGPNLSVTGSLATILWLNALRREDQHVTAWQFLTIGTVVMLPPLLLSLGALLLAHRLQ